MTCRYCSQKIRWYQHAAMTVDDAGKPQPYAHTICHRVYQHGYYRGIAHRSLELLTEKQLRRVIADSERWVA